MRIPFPSPIDTFIELCTSNNIRTVLYGGAITDYLMDKPPRDYDFYLFTTLEHFSKSVLPALGIELKKYGDFVLPFSDVYFLKWPSGIRADLCLIEPEKFRNAPHFFQTYHINWAGGITISSMLYFPQKNCLYDPQEGLRDIRVKVIRTSLDLSLEETYFEKLCRIYLSGLFGKYDDFYLDAVLFEKIKAYNILCPGLGEYLKDFPWRVDTTLAKVMTFPLKGIIQVLLYWDAVGMIHLFLPGIEKKRFADVLSVLRQAKPNPRSYFNALDALTGGLLEKRLRMSRIPQSYKDSMDFEMHPFFQRRRGWDV